MTAKLDPFQVGNDIAYLEARVHMLKATIASSENPIESMVLEEQLKHAIHQLQLRIWTQTETHLAEIRSFGTIRLDRIEADDIPAAQPIEPFPTTPPAPKLDPVPVRELTPIEVTFLEQLQLHMSKIDPVDAAALVLPVLANFALPGSGVAVAGAIKGLELSGLIPSSTQPEPPPMSNDTPSPLPDTKPWYKSKTIIGVLVAFLAMGVSFVFGVQVDQDEQSLLTNSIVDILEIGGVLIGGIIAIIGRIKARKTIGKGPVLPAPTDPTSPQ